MKNQEIYENALRLLAQDSDQSVNDDYLERAPFLIASFCNEVLEIDRCLRLASSLAAAAEFNAVWLDLTANFPLLDRLAPIASLYVAAMLILDEDGELSDKLYDRYCDAIATLRCELPALTEKIVDPYFF